MICGAHEIEGGVVAEDGKSITFQPCGFVSNDPFDVQERFCSRCQRYMELVEFVRRELKERFPS